VIGKYHNLNLIYPHSASHALRRTSRRTRTLCFPRAWMTTTGKCPTTSSSVCANCIVVWAVRSLPAHVDCYCTDSEHKLRRSNACNATSGQPATAAIYCVTFFGSVAEKGHLLLRGHIACESCDLYHSIYSYSMSGSATVNSNQSPGFWRTIPRGNTTTED
jgi:hypothetical protein